MYRPNRYWALVVFALTLCAGAAGDQEAQPNALGVAQEPREYGEYEAIPPPDIDLYPDVPTAVPEDKPETPVPEAHVWQQQTPASEEPSDPLMDEVNRQLEARGGIAPMPVTEPPDLRRTDFTAGSLIKAFAWLLVVIALILLLYHFLQRRTRVGRLLTGNRLGTVLGRLYLNSRLCLHFVRTGGKVLVLGQTQNGVSLIAGFDEAEFTAAVENEESDNLEKPRQEDKPATGRAFFSQLRANLAQMSRQTDESSQTPDQEPGTADVDEDDIAALRGDIHRLQEYLRESTRDSED